MVLGLENTYICDVETTHKVSYGFEIAILGVYKYANIYFKLLHRENHPRTLFLN